MKPHEPLRLKTFYEMAIKSIITGTGSSFPGRRIENAHFENFIFYDKDGRPMSKSGKEIVQKLEVISGIKERRYVREEEDSSNILAEASQNAIADAGIDRNEIGAIIVAHNAGNMLANAKGTFHPIPNLAAVLKNRLHIENHECVAYDILFGCPGWVQGAIQANLLIQAGEAKHVLVVGVEVLSRLLDPHQMDSMLLGDGCGAVLFSAAENSTEGVLSWATFSHALDDLHHISLGPSLNPNVEGHCFFKMNGKEVYRYAATWMPKVIQKALDKVRLTPRDIDLFFFHQANAKMLTAIARNLMQLYGQEKEPYEHKIPSNIAFTGNTSVATIPTLFDLIKRGKMEGFRLEKGQKYVFASVGAGMHCNALVYQG